MRGLPILTFHSIDGSGSVNSVSPRQLDAMLRPLAEAGFRGRAVGAALDHWKRSGDHGREFAISFDDGYANVLHAGLPVLRELGFTATVFVVTGRCGENNDWLDGSAGIPGMPLMAWRDLHELLAGGWEIGSHGHLHLCLPRQARGEIERDVVAAKTAIRERLGVAAPHFAYPYGAHDATVRAVVGEHHELAFGTRLAVAGSREVDERLEVPRVDTYYLRGLPAVEMLFSRRGRAYLAARRLGRTLRGLVAGAVR